MKGMEQLAVGMLCGGLAGSVFSYWVSRPSTTVVTYSTTTTSLSASAATKGIIPELNILIGGEAVPVLNTHSIEITAQKGPPLEHADMAFEFQGPVRFFGKVFTEKPSTLYKLDCVHADAHVTCTLGPLTPGQGSFRIVFVTDQEGPLRATMLAPNTSFVPANAFVASAGRIFGMRVPGAVILAIVFIGLLGGGLASWYVAKRIGKVQAGAAEPPPGPP